ncbi:unnamed protein product [Cunninghamella echinulata]
MDTVMESINKASKLASGHEAPKTASVGAEIAFTAMEHCFLRLEVPIQQVCSWKTLFPLMFENFYMPSMVRCYGTIETTE